jgi:plasmid maintenance system antidote protein VapI
MKNPPHPGDLIRTEVIEALGLTVSKAAEILQDHLLRMQLAYDVARTREHARGLAIKRYAPA